MAKNKIESFQSVIQNNKTAVAIFAGVFLYGLYAYMS